MKWTKQEFIKKFKETKTLKEFKNLYNGGYQMLFKKNWNYLLDKYFIDKENSKQFKDVYFIFSNKTKTIYIGITCNLTDRISLHKRQGTLLVKGLFLENDCRVYKLYNHLTNSKAVAKEKHFINFFKEKGWNVLNQKSGGSLGALHTTIWTKEAIQKKALLFSKSIDFYKAYPGAYDAAQRKGFLQEVTSHIVKTNKPRLITINNKNYTVSELITYTGLSRKMINTDLKKNNLQRILLNFKQ